MAKSDEPDDGGLDWLQSQLGADNEHNDDDEPGDPDKTRDSDTPERAPAEEPAWFASLPARTEKVTPRAAEPVTAEPVTAEPAAAVFDTAEPPTARLETRRLETRSPETRSPETPGAQTTPAPGSDPEPVTDAAAPTSAFSWGLSPTDEPDPKITPRVKPEPTSGSETEPAPASAAPPADSLTHVDSLRPAAPVAPPSSPPVAPGDALPFATADDVPIVPAARPDPADADPAPPAPAEPAVPPPAVTPELLAETETLGPESLTPAVGANRGIRTEADLEPAPWWTTPVQAPLVPTDEEREAGLFSTPVASASDTPTAQPATPTAQPATQTAQPTTQMPAAASVGAGTDDAHAAPAGGGRRGQTPPTGGGGTGRPVSPNTTRTLIWVAAALGAILVLVGLFFLGRQLVGGTPVAAPSPSATETPTPTPTPPPAPTAPQPAGVHAWDTLFGSECVEPYASPWDEEFTVVDCATPHTAQLVYRGVFPGDATTAFPGEEVLAAQINLLCSAPGVIDLAAAGGLPDLQLQGSYPISDEQWTGGQRNYYCFVSRSSGEPLTSSIAGPGPAPAA